MFLDGHKYFQIVECAAFWIFPPAEVTFGNDSFNVSGCLGQLMGPILPIGNEIVKRSDIENAFYPTSADAHTRLTIAALTRSYKLSKTQERAFPKVGISQ